MTTLLLQRHDYLLWENLYLRKIRILEVLQIFQIMIHETLEKFSKYCQLKPCWCLFFPRNPSKVPQLFSRLALFSKIVSPNKFCQSCFLQTLLLELTKMWDFVWLSSWLGKLFFSPLFDGNFHFQEKKWFLHLRWIFTWKMPKTWITSRRTWWGKKVRKE